MASVLDEIPGLGPERKRRLLKEFGSIQEMKHVGAEALSARGKIPRAVADRVIRAIGADTPDIQ
jgi:excinuclease ABC subunit C